MVLDLIVVGDVMLDVSVEAGALAPGGDVHGDVRIRPAGAGANAAVWAAARGAAVRLYGRLGNDVPGRLLAHELSQRGVNHVLAIDPQARTGAMLVVRRSGERSMVADRGANARLSPHDLPERLEARAVLVSGYLLFDPGSQEAATEALGRASARWVAIDAASWPLVQGCGPDRFRQLTKAASVLLANEREAIALAPDSADVEEAARELAHDWELVCVKRGFAGAIALSGHRFVRATPPAVEEADPTGAGDAFDGVLLSQLAGGRTIEDALDAACGAGAAAAASFETWPEP